MMFKTVYFSLLFLAFTACKTPTPPPQTVTYDGTTLTLPEGFKKTITDNEMSFDGIPALQDAYQKMDGSNTTTLKVMRFDVAHLATEDPEYVTEMCLSQYRFFYSEGHDDSYKYSENNPFNIASKKGYGLTYDDTADKAYPLKGEMMAFLHNNKVIVLHINDFSTHFEQTKPDWEAIKKSVKF